MPAFIREATADDLPQLKEIIDLSFPRFFRYFATHSLTKEGKVIVNQTNNGILGFAKLTQFQILNQKYGCILWLAVHPNHRRKGIAASLVEAGTANLKQAGAAAVFASVQHTNRASLETFRSAGFCQMDFLRLWRLFGWRVFRFYREIWFAPGEIALMYAESAFV